jgi:hypothetical protein
MALLLDGATANGAGDTEAMTEPCTVHVGGTFKGARVYLEIGSEDVGPYPISGVPAFSGPGQVVIDAVGPYSLRARVDQAGEGTSIFVEAVTA